MAVLLLITVIVLINYNIVPITIGGFALTSCLMAGVNNIITSMVPLEMKDNVNSGKLAGVLNGFCYIGSTLSAFGLGVIADHFGWSSVFITLLIVLIFVIVIGTIYIIFEKRGKEYEKIFIT